MFLSRRSNEELDYAVDKLGQEAFDELVRKTVHALLILGQERTPIKRLELNKILFSRIPHRCTGAVILAANKELYTVFGLRIFELEDKSKYLIVNAFNDLPEVIEYPDNFCEELTILYLLLTSIFAAPDEKVAEEDFMSNISPLKMDDKVLKEYLDLFLKKLYIKSMRHEDRNYFLWGPRAVAEIEPETFFNSFLQLNQEETDKNWPEQRRRIEKLKDLHRAADSWSQSSNRWS